MISRFLDTVIAQTRPLLHGRFFAEGVDWVLWNQIDGQRRGGGLFDVDVEAVPRVYVSRFQSRKLCRSATGAFDSVYRHPELERNQVTFRWLCGYGEREVVVVLNHGSFGAGGLEERLLAPPLVQRGVDVVLPLTPGFGCRRKPGRGTRDWSSSVAGVVASVLQLARDDLSLAAWLRASGYGRVFVLGLGIGGAAAGMAAARGSGFDGHVVAMIGAHLADLWCAPSGLRVAVDWAALHEAGVRSEDEFRFLMEPASLAALPRPPHSPGRIVAADRDALVPPASVRALSRLWESPVDWIPGGHVAWPVHRRRFVEAVCSLVDETRSGVGYRASAHQRETFRDRAAEGSSRAVRGDRLRGDRTNA